MGQLEVINLSSDEESEVEGSKPKVLSSMSLMGASYNTLNVLPKLEEYPLEESHGPLLVAGVSNESEITEPNDTLANGLHLASTSPISSISFPRQFWKSGDYEVEQVSGSPTLNGQNRLRIHPKFLHSNATSHKWAFGAIAELLDNALDEVHNGATFVAIDEFKLSNNKDPALLIQDDGGGMDPESLRRCMSFGFSDKQSGYSIGQYGNGFKTSTMRLGADAIVFTQHRDGSKSTQSVGLLSYTFLRQMGADDIVVPVVDYTFDTSTGSSERLMCHGKQQFSLSLSTLLKWSPFASEIDLLKQFNDIGLHGTKIIVYNLWHNDDGVLELDFASDSEDILISGSHKNMRTNNAVKLLNENYVANRLYHSLRAYLSILYLRIPVNFRIILRGKGVDYHRIVHDLKYVECIKYKPQVGGKVEVREVVTFLGFLRDAPNINVHGFNIYHKNRLILPFWKVASNSYGKGKGVVGLLEANFIKPTHDKQDFEKSILFQKLETRLKEITYEYWDYHCHLVGYTRSKVIPYVRPTAGALHHGKLNTKTSTPDQLSSTPAHATTQPLKVEPFEAIHLDAVTAGKSKPVGEKLRTVQLPKHNLSSSQELQTVLPEKRKHAEKVIRDPLLKKQVIQSNWKSQLDLVPHQENMEDVMTMIEENKKLLSQCLEIEEREKDLLLKVLGAKVRSELQEAQRVYRDLLLELKLMDRVKAEH